VTIRNGPDIFAEPTIGMGTDRRLLKLRFHKIERNKMSWKEELETLSHIAAIITPICGVIIWFLYKFDALQKQKKLEQYLKEEKAKVGIRQENDGGRRSMLHLMVNVGLTEAEILQASFKSKHIKRWPYADESIKSAMDIFFEYSKH
jgi:hypothetical protein